MPSNKAVVVVDPISTGANLAQLLFDRGWPVIRVFSDGCPEKVKKHTPAGLTVEFVATIEHTGDLDATVAAVRAVGYELEACFVGCETGVLFADLLAHGLSLTGNDVAHSQLRRNKFLQTEAVRSAGLPAAHQALVQRAEQVEEFLSASAATLTESSAFKAVVKPVDGAGSDGVSICDSPDEVRNAFSALSGSTNVLGLQNVGVLLQEYLRGDEFVVDTVSRNGVHKCVALWVYDKRWVSDDAPVVYYGMRCLQVEDDFSKYSSMIAYIFGVLDAIKLTHGAAHSEIKMENGNPRGPLLIEVNGRVHGGEGTWLPIPQECAGYTHISALADATLDGSAFEALPAVPTGLRKRGSWVTVRSNVAGVLSAVDAAKMDLIRALPSYHSEYLPPTLAPGHPVIRTTDACSVHGCFNLINSDAAALERDYEVAQSIIDSGLFSVFPPEVSPASPARSVDSVDAGDEPAQKRQAVGAPNVVNKRLPHLHAPPRPESTETM